MKKLLESNAFILALMVIIICYLLSFISTDLVLSDRVYEKYLNEEYETKYNEYKDLDIDLSEFEYELEQFERSPGEFTYDWGSFYIDTLFVLVPLTLVVLGFSCTLLILILFHKKLHIMKFVALFKVSLLSFLIFYIPEIVSAIYFLIFKRDYELKDIHDFESYFKLSKLFKKET